MAKTNAGLLAYAKAQVGLPYWYGTFGQSATESLYNAKKKQYPKYYTARDFASQYGKRVHDCVGLVKGYLWSDSATAAPEYNAAQDKSAKGMYDAATAKGEIRELPTIAGLLVFKSGDGKASGINHVGIYDGNNWVYEAKGHAYGVVKTAYKASDWEFWAQCPYIEENAAATSEGAYVLNLRNLKKGCKGEDVKALQILLIGNGFSCGGTAADGVFGANTEKAVMEYQRMHELTADGIVGVKTMTMLLGA